MLVRQRGKTDDKEFFPPLICPHLSDLFQLFIILQEESQVHEGDINIRVTAVLPVLFHCVLSSRKCMLVDLQRTDSRGTNIGLRSHATQSDQ